MSETYFCPTDELPLIVRLTQEFMYKVDMAYNYYGTVVQRVAFRGGCRTTIINLSWDTYRNRLFFYGLPKTDYN